MGYSGEGIIKDYDPGLRKSINTGYIIIPEDVDRDQFIEQCLRIKRFSVLVEGGGGVMHNCYITKSALRDIHFPGENETLGCGVVFFSDPFSGKQVITGVVEKDDDTEMDKQEVVTWKKTKDDNYAILSVDGNGRITLDVIGTSKSGEISINVRNNDYSGALNIHVKGNVNIYTEGDTNIKAVDGDVNVTTNQDMNFNVSSNVNVQSKKLIVHNGEEAMVRGDKLQTEIDKSNDTLKTIVDVLTGSTIPEPGNSAPSALQAALNAALQGKEIGDFSEIKSEKSFLE